MSETLRFHFDVDGDNFTSAGQASVQVKKILRELGVSPEIIRKVSIAMYEGEINMVIHAGGGEADIVVAEDYVEIIREVAGYYGIPVLDLHRVSGMQPAVQTLRERYMPDGLHPNDAGHALICSRLKGFLETL